MTDYRKLTYEQQADAEKKLVEEVGFGVHRNEHTGFTWVESGYSLARMREGTDCVECGMIYYNCLCSHDD